MKESYLDIRSRDNREVKIMGEVCGVCGVVYVDSVWCGVKEVCGSCEDWYCNEMLKNVNWGIDKREFD